MPQRIKSMHVSPEIKTENSSIPAISDHVPYRNSKLTRLLQPSLSGDARISVVCTMNPDAQAVPESTSTLQFASRIKRVQLSAKKKEVVDTDALIERYRKEIEELKGKLADREAEAPQRNRRMSAQEVCGSLNRIPLSLRASHHILFFSFSSKSMNPRR